MIEGGYILQPRSVDGSDVMRMPPATREIWFWILRNVNHTYRNGIERGSGFFTFDQISDGLTWTIGFRKMRYSKPQITKAIRRLCEGNMMETTKETRGILVKVLNYDYFQDPSNYEGNNEGITKESRRESSGHTIHKNDKNDKNDKNKNDGINSVSPRRCKNGIDFDFSTGKWTGIEEVLIEVWEKACPAIDVNSELAKASAWLMSNPKNKKSDYKRFLGSWMSRAQDRSPRVNSQPNQHQQTLSAGEKTMLNCMDLMKKGGM